MELARERWARAMGLALGALDDAIELCEELQNRCLWSTDEQQAKLEHLGRALADLTAQWDEAQWDELDGQGG